MILTPEPAIRSCDLGQRILCCNSCQLTIVWMPMIKLNTGYVLPHYLESLTFHMHYTVTNTKASATLVTVHKSTNLILYLLFIICKPTDSVIHLILYQLE